MSCFSILTSCFFYKLYCKDMFYSLGWISYYMYGALLASFQPDVLYPLFLICGCLLILIYSKLQEPEFLEPTTACRSLRSRKVYTGNKGQQILFGHWTCTIYFCREKMHLPVQLTRVQDLLRVAKQKTTVQWWHHPLLVNEQGKRTFNWMALWKKGLY